MYFMKGNLSQTKEDNPNVKHTEIMSIVGKAWSTLSKKKKKEYEKKASKDKERYNKEMVVSTLSSKK